MKATREILALEQILALCQGHDEVLKDALYDLSRRELDAQLLEHPSKEDRRLLGQFAYRYTRMQDDMGARLVPAILRALGEEVAAMSTLDRLDRLEQLAWLPSVDEWSELRRIRNEFTHDYPETAGERHERLQLAITSASRLREIRDIFADKIGQRFGL